MKIHKGFLLQLRIQGIAGDPEYAAAIQLTGDSFHRLMK